MKSDQQSRQPSGLQKWVAYDGRSASAWLYLASLFCISNLIDLVFAPESVWSPARRSVHIDICIIVVHMFFISSRSFSYG